MKRLLSLFLAAFMLLTLAGCGGTEPGNVPEAPVETTVPEINVPETTVAATTVPETTVPTEPEFVGDLFLTVSSINFSVVGESEDIYVGTAPREEIAWTSADESVITVENIYQVMI